MIIDEIKTLIKKRCTLLGVGPMSKNCVDAAIELANECNVPIMLIASRRQIDSKDFGGGYVNNWTTREFAEYVLRRDKENRIILARDHGGPWQSEVEKQKRLNLHAAMESAKKSYKADIDSGFHALHIDPSIDIHEDASTEQILDRIFELYEYCWSYAQKTGKEIIFEVGTEEQSGGTNTPEQLDYVLNKILGFCKANSIPKPTFVVVQTGTRVLEMRNVGSFDSPLRVTGELAAEIQIPRIVETCNRHNVLMKAHNVDYLSDEALQWYPRLGIHAANVAPEFGVTETRAFLALLERFNLHKLVERFLDIAYSSNKWKKWMTKESHSTDRERAIIAGHYIFCTQDYAEIKDIASLALDKFEIDLDIELKKSIKYAISRYMHNFRLSNLS